MIKKARNLTKDYNQKHEIPADNVRPYKPLNIGQLEFASESFEVMKERVTWQVKAKTNLRTCWFWDQPKMQLTD